MKTRYFVIGKVIHSIRINENGMDVYNTYRPCDVNKISQQLSWVSFSDRVCGMYDLELLLQLCRKNTGDIYFIADDANGRIEVYNKQSGYCTHEAPHPRMYMKVEDMGTHHRLYYVDPEAEIDDTTPYQAWYSLRDLLETIGERNLCMNFYIRVNNKQVMPAFDNIDAALYEFNAMVDSKVRISGEHDGDLIELVAKDPHSKLVLKQASRGV